MNQSAEFTLTPEALLPDVEFTEAERLAIDHTINALKRSDAYQHQRDMWAIRFELNYGSRS